METQGLSTELSAGLNAFKAATSKELRKLCRAGYSHGSAVSILLSRICCTKNSPTAELPDDLPEVTEISAETGIGAKLALRAFVVQREMRKLQADGMAPEAAVAKLTELVAQETSSGDLGTAPIAQKATKPARSLRRSRRLSSGETERNDRPVAPPVPPISLPAVQASVTAAAANPSAVKVGQAAAPSPRSSGSTPSTPAGRRAATAKRVTGTKRSRRSVETKDSGEADTEKKDLTRQIQSLTTEINEAMRSNDRAKVARLMRQREQLRSSCNKRGVPKGPQGAQAEVNSDRDEQGSACKKVRAS